MQVTAAFIFGGLFGLGLGLFIARSKITGTLHFEIVNPEKPPFLYFTINPNRQMDLYDKRYIMVEVKKDNQPRY